MAIISMGVFMSTLGKSNIGEGSQEGIFQFWSYAEFCTQTIIFQLSGVLVGFQVFGVSHSFILPCAPRIFFFHIQGSCA